MCCFRLHFSDLNVLISKNKKTCCSLVLNKITCCAKREKKITCREENPSPHWISNGPSLTDVSRAPLRSDSVGLIGCSSFIHFTCNFYLKHRELFYNYVIVKINLMCMIIHHITR